MLVAVGVASHLDCDAVLGLREFHPSAQAGFQLHLQTRDGVIRRADPRMGLMHRSAEKLFEARDYRQIMMLANRHDWLSPFASELGVALAVEAATGITPPERATWIRTLLAEANRITAALAFLGAAAPAGASAEAIRRARERMVDTHERITGARVHPMFARIGGVAGPLTAAHLDDVEEVIGVIEALQPELADAVLSRTNTLTGVAPLTRAEAIGYGTSGVVARASGLDIDLRRDEPYAAYGRLQHLLTVPTRTDGDAAARYQVLVEQVPVSAALIAACVTELRELGDGPIDVPLPKVVRAPEGVSHAWLEGPLGISGYLLASVGEKTPWRLKIRSASFNNVQAMGHALTGTQTTRLADAVESYFFMVGDADR